MIAAIKRITVDARPEALTIEPARTAIIVVDMQNDFGAHGGMMELAGIDIAGNRAVIPATSRVLAAARQARILVVYLKMAFRADLSKEERTSMVELLCEKALIAIPLLVHRRDIQDAVDVTVCLVDVSLKTENQAALNRVLSWVDPDVLPPEVVLAFLTTSRPAGERLDARAKLVSRFERAIRARRRPDADALVRFAQ